jgi:TRAP-type C4-dicarboxylate transport system permease small subunit
MRLNVLMVYPLECARGGCAVKIFNLLNKALEIFLVAIVVLQSVLLMGGVFFRYLFNSPIVWGDEIVRYSLIWMTFVGAAMATKENQHISVDVIDQVLPRRGQKVLNWLVDAVVIAFMAFFIFYGIRMTDFQRGMFGETLSWFSYAYVYVSIPIGAFFTILYTITKYVIKQDDGLAKG